MASIENALTQHHKIGIDTSVFIYHFESNAKYLPLTTTILEGIQNGRWRAVTSVIALMEINVHPWRMGKPRIAQTYETLLTHFPNLRIIDTNRDIARKAAQIRATYNFRSADALHIATAINSGATAWVCNDKQHRRLSNILDVFVLDDFLEYLKLE